MRNLLWKAVVLLGGCVPGKKRCVVWKTFNKSLNLKDALSCLAHPGFDVTPTTVVLRVGRDVLRRS